MIGASFIGLEVAAALRVREIEVHVVALERRPLEREIEREFGDFVRAIHEQRGVVCHLEERRGRSRRGASPISCEAQRLSHSLFVSGRFAMIYVVDAKFFESTAGDTDRCLESPFGVVRDGARVKSPEAVMRRLLRRKVK